MNPGPMLSVRPPTIHSDMGGGPASGVDKGRRRDRRVPRLCATYSSPVCPVAEAYGNEEEHVGKADEITAQEEEDAYCPPPLPSVYQPTWSEYMDHCITHFPFRAWCRHCLEGRGREFGHDRHRGDKDERLTPVIAFDYCFVSDVGEVTTLRSLMQLVMELPRSW